MRTIISENDWLHYVNQAFAYDQNGEINAGICEGLSSVVEVHDMNVGWFRKRIQQALDAYHKDLSNMEEGEARLFHVRGDWEVYEINKKMKALYAKHRREPDKHQKFSFRKLQLPNGFLRVVRNFN